MVQEMCQPLIYQLKKEIEETYLKEVHFRVENMQNKGQIDHLKLGLSDLK
jgi:hypothetical protein